MKLQGFIVTAGANLHSGAPYKISWINTTRFCELNTGKKSLSLGCSKKAFEKTLDGIYFHSVR